MDRVSAAYYITISGKRYWADESLPSTNGTELAAIWHNGVQESIILPVEAVGIAPSDGDNTQLQQAIQIISGAKLGSVITANATLTPQQSGLVIVDASGGPFTLTLPQVSALGASIMQRFRIVRRDTTWSNAITVAYHAGDSLLLAAPGLLTQFYPTIELVGDGGTHWVSFTPGASSPGASGWESSPGGVIRMWGSGTSATGNGDTITFPVPFPTACDVVDVNEQAAAGSWSTAGAITAYGASGKTTSGFTLYSKNVSTSAINFGAGLSYGYVAIGR